MLATVAAIVLFIFATVALVASATAFVPVLLLGLIIVKVVIHVEQIFFSSLSGRTKCCLLTLVICDLS